tara:strand:- start:11 stop:544 length:534 start_codon:yes stop_codon:yes gene_type:complete
MTNLYGNKLYVDMDGVIADFFGVTGLPARFNVPHWKQIPLINEALQELVNTNFFFMLEPFPTSASLIAYVRSLTRDYEGWEWGICSSPLRNDRDNSAYWKRRWLEKHDFMPMPHNFVITSTKENYAINEIDGSPNILIDDKPSNIDRWRGKGGIGILYQANKHRLSRLFDKLSEQVK